MVKPFVVFLVFANLADAVRTFQSSIEQLTQSRAGTESAIFGGRTGAGVELYNVASNYMVPLHPLSPNQRIVPFSRSLVAHAARDFGLRPRSPIPSFNLESFQDGVTLSMQNLKDRLGLLNPWKKESNSFSLDQADDKLTSEDLTSFKVALSNFIATLEQQEDKLKTIEEEVSSLEKKTKQRKLNQAVSWPLGGSFFFDETDRALHEAKTNLSSFGAVVENQRALLKTIEKELPRTIAEDSLQKNLNRALEARQFSKQVGLNLTLSGSMVHNAEEEASKKEALKKAILAYLDFLYLTDH